MTAIFGTVHQGHVFLCGDSQKVDRGHHVVPSKRPKVWRSGPGVMGSAGSQLVQQTLQCQLDLTGYSGANPPFEYVAGSVVPEIQRLLRDAGVMLRDSEGLETMDACLLIGLDGQLLEIQQGFGVIDAALGYGAIGSGACYCLGAAWMLTQLGHGRYEMLPEIMAAAVRFNSGVAQPFHLVGTDGTDVTLASLAMQT